MPGALLTGPPLLTPAAGVNARDSHSPLLCRGDRWVGGSEVVALRKYLLQKYRRKKKSPSKPYRYTSRLKHIHAFVPGVLFDPYVKPGVLAQFRLP